VNKKDSLIELEQAAILITDHKINSIFEINRILEYSLSNRVPFFIIYLCFDNEFFRVYLSNKKKYLKKFFKYHIFISIFLKFLKKKNEFMSMTIFISSIYTCTTYTIEITNHINK
ncbi:hypothetical protein OC713_02600, partial [Sweet potato little leaf phytoplasma]|nr:hypothetical protein [Sweet potato little leaf phytoplasma]